MKKTILALTLMSLSSAIFAETQSLKISCKTNTESRPGAENVTLTGTLSLSKHPTYPAPAKIAKGELELTLKKSIRNGVRKSTLKVQGQYDKNAYGEAVNLGVIGNEEIGSIYINFAKDDNLSNIEVAGRAISFTCTKL